MDTARLSKMSVPKTIFVSEPDRDLGEVRLGDEERSTRRLSTFL
jgi:hypothetical protein